MKERKLSRGEIRNLRRTICHATASPIWRHEMAQSTGWDGRRVTTQRTGKLLKFLQLCGASWFGYGITMTYVHGENYFMSVLYACLFLIFIRCLIWWEHD